MNIPLKFALATIVATARLWGCAIAYQNIPVGLNFQIQVKDTGWTVEGLRVELSGKGDTKIVENTDKNGIATFRGVAPGAYHFIAKRDATSTEGTGVEVKPDGPQNVTVPLQWDGIAPSLVRSVKGTLQGTDYAPEWAQSPLSLGLLDAATLRKLASLQTNEKGEFDFGSVAPGRYFLTKSPGGPSVRLTVDPNAPVDHMEINFGSTSCGAWYTDAAQCPRADLQIQKLSGQVRDPSGAWIPNAKILLLDSTDNVLERLQTDREAKFVLSHELAGTYTLDVHSLGFAPWRGTVRVVLSDAKTESILTVRLGLGFVVGGSCSSAEVR